MNAKIKSAAVQHNSYTLTCPTRWIFKKFVEIVASSVTCSNWFSSFKISRVPHISWCAGLYIFFYFLVQVGRTERQTRCWTIQKCWKRWGREKKKNILDKSENWNNNLPDSTHGLCARIFWKLFWAEKHMPTGSLRPMKM